MKKFLSVLSITSLLVSGITGIPVRAAETEITSSVPLLSVNPLLTNAASQSVDENELVNLNGLLYRDNLLVGVEDTDVTSVFIPAEINGQPVEIISVDHQNDSDKNIFSDCKKLEEIIVDEKNENYLSIDGVLFSKDKKNLYVYPPAKVGDYAIPDGVERIQECAFSHCHGLKKIIIPSSLIETESSNAFYNCINLEEVINPIPVHSTLSFWGCTNLKSLSIKPSSGTKGISICKMQNFPFLEHFEISGEAEIQDILIGNCPKLKEFSCLDTKAIEEKRKPSLRVNNCENLEIIKIDNTRNTEILRCPNLKNIDMTDRHTNEVEYTFVLEELPLLKSVSIYDNFYNVNIKNCNSLTDIIVKDCGFEKHSPQKFTLDNLTLFNTIKVYSENQNIQGYEFDCSDCNEFSVYGYSSNEVLKDCCNKYQIPFILLENTSEETRGDVTGDGRIDILDVISINKAILGKENLTDSQNKVADVNKNDKVDSSDSLMILKYIVGLINSFDV